MREQIDDARARLSGQAWALKRASEALALLQRNLPIMCDAREGAVGPLLASSVEHGVGMSVLNDVNLDVNANACLHTDDRSNEMMGCSHGSAMHGWVG